MTVEQGKKEIGAGQRVTLIGAVGNLGLTGAKYVVGVLAHSRALVADAAHSLSDLLSDAIVLIGLHLGRAEPDEDHHFGHGRIETLASVLVGLTLLGVAGALAYEAGTNIYNYQPGKRVGWPAAVMAGASIGVKELLYQLTIRVARHLRSVALVANAWHHRSDALSSVAVLIGVGAALFEPRWQVLDSYAALIVSALVAKVGLSVLWGGVREMTDAAPARAVVEEITHTARGTEGVLGVHDVRARTSGGVVHVQLHVQVDGEQTVAEGHRIAKAVEHRLRDEVPQVDDVMVHVDPEEEPPGSR